MKTKIYFITGNKNKAKYLNDFLEISLGHRKIDLKEIQTMSLRKIVEEKVREAYKIVQAPVLVEDVSLEFKALGNLPGPFIKFFIDNMDLQNICSLLEDKNRQATARCVFGYFDGSSEEYFEGFLNGEIAVKPRGSNGYGWDRIFVPDGYGGRTRAELTPKEDKETYLKIKPLEKIKKFLQKQY